MSARSDDESRRHADRSLILARREFLIASALAGAALGACDKKTEPSSGVDATPERDAEPMVCLSIPSEEPDAGTRPRVCLSQQPPRPTVRPPADSKPDSCRPPTYVDRNGINRVKPGCL